MATKNQTAPPKPKNQSSNKLFHISQIPKKIFHRVYMITDTGKTQFKDLFLNRDLV